MSRDHGLTLWRTPTTLLLAGLLAFLRAVPALADETAGDEDEKDDQAIIGGQDVVVDAPGDRDARFDRNAEFPSGVVLEFLRYSTDTSRSFLQLQVRDVSQRDEGLALRAGLGDRYRFRAAYQSLPYRYGSGAKFVLGDQGADIWGPTFRIADFSQRLFQDPDGDGTPFFTSAAETASDNALVAVLANDLLTGFDRFGLESRRRQGGAGVTIRASEYLRFDIDAFNESRSGTQALGTGTYQRITDVNADGITDYDYFFSIRGLELPAILDYRTSRYEARASYQKQRWFADVRTQVQEFDNAFVGLTYDNPFWFDGVNATTGSRRGLWEFGRASYEPSNRAWDVAASAGVDLPGRTRLTAAISMGEHTQDVSILPISTNPANIATADINFDGVINADDDPTVQAIPGLPPSLNGIPTLGRSLDATSDTLSYYLQVTSKPLTGLTLTGRYRYYDYEGKEGIIRVPARAEYVESFVQLDFKGDDILHVPLDWSRETINLEAAYRFHRNFRLKGFAGRKSYDYDQYRDDDGNVTRERGSRVVAGTDDDFLGLTAMFGHGGWLSGRATWQTSERDFDGAYTIGFAGELTTARQYDVAHRDQDAASIHLDFMLGDRTTLGVGYRTTDDDYPRSQFGFQEAESTGWTLNVNIAPSDRVNVFAYLDVSEWDVDMHLRTKCGNCTVPPGFAPWDVPNFDWFTDYTDETSSYGAGIDWRATGKTDVMLSISYVKGEIEQRTANPGTPVEGNPGNPLFGTTANVALGFDFPT